MDCKNRDKCGGCTEECVWRYVEAVKDLCSEEITVLQVITMKGGSVVSTSCRAYVPSRRASIIADSIEEGVKQIKNQIKRTLRSSLKLVALLSFCLPHLR